jgi:thiol-disulfide isomerase/thioredoxin
MALVPGEVAPDIWGKRMDNGAALKLSQLRGKVVYVDFWASWCAPCRVSMPLLNDLHRELEKQGFMVLGVNVDKEAEPARQILRSSGAQYPVLREVGDSTYDWYDIRGMPAAYVVDRKGRVRIVHSGFHKSDWPALRAEVEKLVRGEAP